MKFLKIFFIIILIFIVLSGIGLFVFIKTFDINKYKSQITSELSEALGRDVDVAAMALNFAMDKGFRFEIKDILIAGDTPELPLIKANVIYLDINISEIISSKSISLALVVGKEITINLSAKDSAESSPTALFIKHITFKASKIAMNTNFPFALDASLWRDKKNISLEGSVRIDQDKKEIYLKDTQFSLNLEDFVMEDVLKVVPSLKEAGIQGDLEGKVQLTIKEMVVSEEGLQHLRAQGQLVNGKVKLEALAYPVENIDIRFHMTEKDVLVDEMFLYLASGKIQGRARVEDYWVKQNFNFNINFEDIHIGELVPEETLPVKVEGNLSGNMEGKGAGFSEEQLETMMRADGTLEVKSGKILDVNVLKIILSHLSKIPNVGVDFEENLPERYKKSLQLKDTILEKVEIESYIENAILFLKKGEVGLEGFTLLTKGQLNLAQHLVLEANGFIPQDLSQSMIGSVEEFSTLLDEYKRIKVPMRSYQGSLENLIMYPDLEDFGKKMLKVRGKQELKKVLFKALDIDEEEQPLQQELKEGDTDPNKPSEESLPPKQPRPEEILIDSIFDAIFQ
ncbi:hypothetical protein MNBD_GAMMA03-135 [hydrothermal vent metagenome]|uniref:AsmA-like C-terminal domain-containing protein n=1 Tax=hydrothermal vent metagenome TaxID=652676 RepID=A0A3B0WDV3_9ZZZZ